MRLTTGLVDSVKPLWKWPSFSLSSKHLDRTKVKGRRHSVPPFRLGLLPWAPPALRLSDKIRLTAHFGSLACRWQVMVLPILRLHQSGSQTDRSLSILLHISIIYLLTVESVFHTCTPELSLITYMAQFYLHSQPPKYQDGRPESPYPALHTYNVHIINEFMLYVH